MVPLPVDGYRHGVGPVFVRGLEVQEGVRSALDDARVINIDDFIENEWLLILDIRALAMVGKFCLSISFSSIYM